MDGTIRLQPKTKRDERVMKVVPNAIFHKAKYSSDKVLSNAYGRTVAKTFKVITVKIDTSIVFLLESSIPLRCHAGAAAPLLMLTLQSHL